MKIFKENFELIINIRYLSYYFLCVYLIYLFSLMDFSVSLFYMSMGVLGITIISVEKLFLRITNKNDKLLTTDRVKKFPFIFRLFNILMILFKYMGPLMGSFVGLGMFLNKNSEMMIYNNPEAICRILAIIVVLFYSIFQFLNYVKKIVS